MVKLRNLRKCPSALFLPVRFYNVLNPTTFPKSVIDSGSSDQTCLQQIFHIETIAKIPASGTITVAETRNRGILIYSSAQEPQSQPVRTTTHVELRILIS